jgi:hypothetical protein
MDLAVMSMTGDGATDIARRETLTEIARRVLVDLLIPIAATIAVVVTTTSTTFLSALVAIAAAATAATATATVTWRIWWGWIVAMLATWMF